LDYEIFRGGKMEEQQPTTNNKEKTWFEATYEELESILWSVMCSQDELSAQLASYMEKLTEVFVETWLLKFAE